MRLKLVLFVLLLTLSINVYSQDDAKAVYLQACRDAAEGSPDFAFIHFNAIADSYKDSEYYSPSLFALGEYYFQNKDYSNAKIFFSRVLAAGRFFRRKFLLRLIF